jgi:hypothetical protein
VIVAIVIAAAVILGGIIVVAMGRGGELARERPELPGSTDFTSWSDVADYRPPAALIGYNAAATEQALALIARSIAERDAEIDWLRGRLAEFQPESLDDAATEAAADAAAGATAELPAEGDDAGPPVAEARWQAGGSASSVASFAVPQPVSRHGGDDQ